MSEIDRLREIVAKLRAPDGCPWDREQTHASLRSSLIEEAYEVCEAIDNKDDAHLREELGDLLLQVVMHAQMASETVRFDFDEIAREIADKLVRRHPHVFGENKLADSAAVLKQWDEIKRAEKGKQSESILANISHAMPALMRAEKVQKRVARVGFDWTDLHSVVEKIREEVLEVEAEIRRNEHAKLEEELGDLLFAVVNLTRKAKFDAELLLNAATNKFVERFQKLEAVVNKRAKKVGELSLTELDGIWDEIKNAERQCQT